MAQAKRKDKARTVLKTGEGQRSNGTYYYRWQDKKGNRHYLYAKSLSELREIEKEVEKEVDQKVDQEEVQIMVDMILKMVVRVMMVREIKFIVYFLFNIFHKFKLIIILIIFF